MHHKPSLQLLGKRQSSQYHAVEVRTALQKLSSSLLEKRGHCQTERNRRDLDVSLRKEVEDLFSAVHLPERAKALHNERNHDDP